MISKFTKKKVITSIFQKIHKWCMFFLSKKIRMHFFFQIFLFSWINQQIEFFIFQIFSQAFFAFKQKYTNCFVLDAIDFKYLYNKIVFFQLQLAAMSGDVSREELHAAAGGDSSSGGGASPLTARSLRLERVAQALAHSQEELRRYIYFLFLNFRLY